MNKTSEVVASKPQDLRTIKQPQLPVPVEGGNNGTSVSHTGFKLANFLPNQGTFLNVTVTQGHSSAKA